MSQDKENPTGKKNISPAQKQQPRKDKQSQVKEKDENYRRQQEEEAQRRRNSYKRDGGIMWPF